MENREQAKDALRAVGFEEPTMRMVRRVTRQNKVVLGPCEAYTTWSWKYHESTLHEALRHALEELGPTCRAVKIAERAFHGARTSKQVFANLDRLISWTQKKEEKPPKADMSYGPKEAAVSTGAGAYLPGT